MCEPTYQDLKAEKIPHAHPSKGIDVTVISGSTQGSEKEGLVSGPIETWGGCHYWFVRLDKKGDKYWQDIKKNWATFAYVVQGSASFGGSDTVAQHSVNVFSAEPDQNGIFVQADSDNVQLAIISGEPLDQPIVCL